MIFLKAKAQSVEILGLKAAPTDCVYYPSYFPWWDLQMLEVWLSHAIHMGL